MSEDTDEISECCPFCVDSEGFAIELDGDGICLVCGYDSRENEEPLDVLP